MGLHPLTLGVLKHCCRGERGGTNGDTELRCAPASYTDTDEHKIQHCFCYTSTVLTSTLAFQKEQKLKCECQVSMCRAMSHACVCPILL